ncbi:restriction endonuclease subunit S [Dolosicoccus paucivorans]|uniref:restriction endonuclease subunit S n=1 Tax=Dolosicoccus paucivorans TaxID=84521 RepID=UPI000C7FFE11|nr:restriction endonuclease subunit S [Dolosicoccus paucivorans]PMB83740.1 restriction endonuclease subunit S [Dolosicoccus paucivorans]
MSKEKLVPKLRFEEFKQSETWKVIRLGENATFINGRAYSQEELLDNGKYKVLRVGNFYTNDSWYYSNFELNNKYYAEYGDLLYTWSASFGPHIWKGEKVIYHYHIWKIELNKKLDKIFLLQLLEEDKKQILTNVTGSTMVHITKSGMEEKNVIIPENIYEQQKIGIFFKKIDEMIQLQQSKVNKVKNIKSAYLSEIFPKEGEKYPKKRFEGFTEPWTAKKLGSLLDYEQPTNYLVKSDSYDDSYLTPVLTAGKSFLLGYTNETEGIYKADNNNGVIIFDDFTTSSHFVDFDFKVKSSAMKFLRTNQSNFNLYFLYNLLTSINYSPESHERHWISIFSEFEVLVPTKKEQEKIAQLFKNLDNQISIEEKKLAKLENLKQGYLNDMFV